MHRLKFLLFFVFISLPLRFGFGDNAADQKAFESGAFVFPNPVRSGQGTFQMTAIRSGANLSLKIYTITGTLVLEQSFPGVPLGTSVTFNWNGTNGSGNKVGR